MLLLLLACVTTPPAEPPAEPARPGGSRPAPSLLLGALHREAGGWTLHAGDGRIALPLELAAAVDEALGADAPRGVGLFTADNGTSPPTLTAWRCVAREGGCGPVAEGVEWSLHGTEPFWSLDIGRDAATWRSPEDPAPVPLTIDALFPNSWTLRDAKGEAWEVQVDEAPCSDGMADARWHATATVQGPRGALRGCGLYAVP